MTLLAFLPIVLSLLILGAHFLRFGAMLPVAGTALLLGLLMIRRPWAARIVQVALVLATVEWLRTTLHLTLERMHAGLPYVRMVAILALVTAMTAFSAWLFQTDRIGSVYGLRRSRGGS